MLELRRIKQVFTKTFSFCWYNLKIITVTYVKRLGTIKYYGRQTFFLQKLETTRKMFAVWQKTEHQIIFSFKNLNFDFTTKTESCVPGSARREWTQVKRVNLTKAKKCRSVSGALKLDRQIFWSPWIVDRQTDRQTNTKIWINWNFKLEPCLVSRPGGSTWLEELMNGLLIH